MRKIPIHNSYIYVATIVYWVLALMTGTSIIDLAISTAIAVAATFAMHLLAGGIIGAGVTKALGVSFLWLGFSSHFMLYLVLVFILAGFFAGIRKVAGYRDQSIEFLPFLIIAMVLIFPSSELGQQVIGYANSLA